MWPASAMEPVGGKPGRALERQVCDEAVILTLVKALDWCQQAGRHGRTRVPCISCCSAGELSRSTLSHTAEAKAYE